MDGWISIHRKLLQWEWYTNSNMVHLALHLLLKANHAPKTWRGIALDRGQLITGRKQLSTETGISVQTVRTCLHRLKKTQFLTLSSTRQFTIITISKYDDYQTIQAYEPPANQPTTNQQSTSNQPTTNQQLTTNNKENKENKVNKEIKEKSTSVKKNETKMPPAALEAPAACDHTIDDIPALFAAWCPSLPMIRVMHETRKKNLANLLKKVSRDQLLEVFQLAGQSAFLTGQNDRGWKADFDWIIKPANFYKILEGKYNNPKQNEKFKPNDPRASQSAGWDIPL